MKITALGNTNFARKIPGFAWSAKMTESADLLLLTLSSKQWIYLLAEGAYGIMRSSGWTGNRLSFEGDMTMIGVNCVLRQTWTKKTDDEFSFVNEEKLP